MIRTNDMIIAGVGIGISVLAIYLIKGVKKKPQQRKDFFEPIATKEEVIRPKPNVVVKREVTTPVKQDQKKGWLLEKGSTAKQVERLQIFLLRNHGWQGTITKVFDDQTEKLVQKIFKKDSVDKATYDKHQMGIPIHELIKS